MRNAFSKPDRKLWVTYTAPNRAHHYPVAVGLHRHQCLAHFVSGFSRLSPRSPLPQLAGKVERVDLVQTLYVLSTRMRTLSRFSIYLNRLSNRRLDRASFRHAANSSVFLYYRTTGVETCRRLKRRATAPLCILEEVNSHVLSYEMIMKREFETIYRSPYHSELPDLDARLTGYEEADFILCPSTFVLNSFLERGFSKEKLLKVPYGTPQAAASPAAPSKNSGCFRVLYVGQLHYRKGLRYLMEAFRQLNHPRKQLIIVGPTTEHTGLETTEVPPGVEFLGTLKGAALSEQYRRATVFVLPSIEEGLALVQGEALSHGIPVITTTNSGGEDLLRDGEHGFIVPPMDAEAIRHYLQLLADHPAQLKTMAAKAVEHAKTFASWTRSVDDLVTTLEGALQRKRRMPVGCGP